MTTIITRLGRCGGSIILAVVLLVATINMVQGAGSLTRITTATPPGTGGQWPDVNSRQSRLPIIIADGTKIAFESDSDFWGQGIITGQTRIWLYDTTTMTLTHNITRCHYSLSGNGQKMAVAHDSGGCVPGFWQETYEVLKTS